MNIIKPDANIFEIALALKYNPSLKNPGGFAIVVDNNQTVIGVISDSDLRKIFVNKQLDILDLTARKLMREDFLFLTLEEFESRNFSNLSLKLDRRNISQITTINFIPVLDKNRKLIRTMHITDLLENWNESVSQIVIIGLGYVGLTLALAFAEKDRSVLGVDSNAELIQMLKIGKTKVYEPEIEKLLLDHTPLHLIFSDSFSQIDHLRKNQIRHYIVCVGTPLKNDLSIDESYINDALEVISQNLRKGDSVILRSTVPIGFTRKAGKKIESISGLTAGIDFTLGYAPERTVEGNAIKECMSLPQIYAGLTNRCSNVVQNVFKIITDSQIKIDSIESCEMGKLISNAYRDVVFGFSNEIALIAKNNNIDINKLIENVNSGYSRNQIAMPSPGVGGPCLSKDSYMLALDEFTENSLILSARKINEKIPGFWASELIEISKKLNKTKILIIGIAFKGNPETNDTRNSPSLEIAQQLKKANLNLRVIDAIVTHSEIELLRLDPLQNNENWLPEIICVLNNNVRNIQIFKDILSVLNISSKIILFDPWYMCTNYYHDMKISQVITLSKKLSNE